MDNSRSSSSFSSTVYNFDGELSAQLEFVVDVVVVEQREKERAQQAVLDFGRVTSRPSSPSVPLLLLLSLSETLIWAAVVADAVQRFGFEFVQFEF